jgi:L-threonylcarbamoyladenylate synthase
MLTLESDGSCSTQVIEAVADALSLGGVALVPTDTVYGLIASPLVPSAVDTIYEVKQRPRERLLPIIATTDMIVADEAFEVTAVARNLMMSYWPGALTLALGLVEDRLPMWLAGRDEAAVRWPQSALIDGLLLRLGPLVMTSANLSGGSIPLTTHDVLRDLAGEPHIVVDGGPLGAIASTLVNVNLDVPRIERQGPVVLDPAHLS